MKLEELQELYEGRREGESINDTLSRTKKSSTDLDLSYDEELFIPRMKIIQPSCQIDDATVGCFKNTITREEHSKLELVFLLQKNTRALFLENDFSGQRRCYSYDGYKPSADVEEFVGQKPISNQCAYRKDRKTVFVCPMANWRNEFGETDPKGKKQPLCKPTISFLAVLKDSLLPCWFTFHGSALVEVKQFLQFVKYKREELKRLGESVSLYDFSLSLKLELVTNSRGKFYIPKFEEIQFIASIENRNLFKKCYEALKPRFSFEFSEGVDESS